jgi:hypothetical protein
VPLRSGAASAPIHRVQAHGHSLSVELPTPPLACVRECALSGNLPTVQVRRCCLKQGRNRRLLLLLWLLRLLRARPKTGLAIAALLLLRLQQLLSSTRASRWYGSQSQSCG